MPITTDEQRARKRAYNRAWARGWRLKNPEKAREKDHRTYLKDREKILARAKAKHHKTWPARSRRRTNLMLAAQEAEAGRPKPTTCEVCGSAGRIIFDHCHQRGVFRGFICNDCNAALGLVKDDPNRLRMLAAYLERTKGLISPQLELPV